MSQAGILTGRAIDREVVIGSIEIDPFDPRLINPVSVDLRLGQNVAVYRVGDLILRDLAAHMLSVESLDAKKENQVVRFDIPEDGLVLKPGVLYLMHTLERVHTKRFVPVLDGKSSIGRLGIKVHETAGYGDPGFDGQYTLEVTCVHPVRVYAGMRFCQMRFHTMVGEVSLYGHNSNYTYGHNSNYTGVLAQGPVPSRSFKQFDEDDGSTK